MLEFDIESKPELHFRFKDISPIKMLALQTTINFDDFDKASNLFSFILENTEVNISGTWQPVKMVNREVYLPVGIEKELNTLMEICLKFINDVVKPLFKKSEE